MLLFDAHLDIAMNAIDWNRDLRQDVDDIRAQEISLGMTDVLGRGTNTLSFPEMRKAEIGICLATLIARQEQQINHPMGRTTPEACYAMAHAQLAYYRAMERTGYMRMLKTAAELDKQVLQLRNDAALTPLGFILTMEGADPLLTPDTIFEFHESGLRSLGLTHYGGNRYGGGTRTEIGLAIDAIPLLKNAEQLGMTIDMTHLSDVAFWQVLDNFSGRIHASHQNSRRICNWQRQFNDEQYSAVIEHGGVIGMAFDVIMLQPGFVRRQSKPEMTMDRVVENIEIVCQLAGNAKHVGIGSDLDGGYGYEQTPADLNKISDLQKLPDKLSERGYSHADIESIMHGNWLRFFGEVLP
jgi:membrane dipeptidase